MMRRLLRREAQASVLQVAEDIVLEGKHMFHMFHMFHCFTEL